MMRFRTACVVALSTVLLACEHSAPFRPGESGSLGPLHPGALAQLTYNPGQDLTPAWLTDGSTVVYTAERLDRNDRDRCLAFMPGVGGVVARYSCRTTAPDDSLNVFDEAAPFTDGRIAYIHSSNSRAIPRIGPDAQQLVVASGDSVLTLQRIPFTPPWGQTYDALSFIAWLGSHRLVMIGDSVSYRRPCSGCVVDTVRTGIEIFTLDFAATLQWTLVPGTAGATSVSVGATGDTIYFTKTDDSLIYRYAFSSAREDTAHNFGGGHVVRDIRVANGFVVAIVDGRVHDGGIVHLLNLATGMDLVAENAVGGQLHWFQRPALSPDARSVVSQGRVLTLTPILDGGGAVVGVDTAAAPGSDLWLFQLR